MDEEPLECIAKKQEDMKQWEDAYNTYCRLYSEEPSEDILGKMAWCASRANLLTQSIQHYTQLTINQPQISKWYYGVGYQYYMQKNWKEASEWFKKALVLYPDYFVVKYRLGYSLRQLCGTKQVLSRSEFWQALKQFDECDAIWDKMSAENQSKNASVYADICYHKGKMLFERKNLLRAAECLNKSLEIKTVDNDDCKYQLAKVYYDLDEPKKALAALPNNSHSYYVTELNISILVKLGELEKAASLLTKHLQQRNKDYLHRELAEIYLKLEKKRESFQEASTAIKLNNKNHINHYIFAQILFSIGFLAKAEDEAKAANDLKIASFGSEYLEANELLKKITYLKKSLHYENDDQAKLKEYSTLLENPSKQKLTGRIDIYNEDRGFGFIVHNGIKYFFHISSFPKYLQPKVKVGCVVEFYEESTEKGLSAKDIQLQ